MMFVATEKLMVWVGVAYRSDIIYNKVYSLVFPYTLRYLYLCTRKSNDLWTVLGCGGATENTDAPFQCLSDALPCVKYAPDEAALKRTPMVVVAGNFVLRCCYVAEKWRVRSLLFLI